MPVGNPFEQATRDYEAWLGSCIEIDPVELADKHTKMKDDPFEFLRASFYRWAQLWRENASQMDLDKAPEVLGVGDLHVENYGTWRDIDGRLAWGINDFDEACPLPYINDIVRLGVSVAMALSSKKTKGKFHPTVTAEMACNEILDGYLEGMKASNKHPDERRPFVLAEDHKWLRSIALNKLNEQDEDGRTRFEQIVAELSQETLPPVKFAVPPVARAALLCAFPPPVPTPPLYRLGLRKAGLGSLGRQRFTAIVDDWFGGLIAREAKALAPSAWVWAGGNSGSRDIWYATALQESVRASDPWIRVQDGWVVRRLAPDAGKIKLADMPPELDDKLLHAMGKETANVHSWSREPLQRVSEDLGKRAEQDPEWFHKAVARMQQATLEDWENCKTANFKP